MKCALPLGLGISRLRLQLFNCGSRAAFGGKKTTRMRFGEAPPSAAGSEFQPSEKMFSRLVR